jgi:hypothetical protein
MWLIPFLVIGALVIAAASRSPREASPARQPALPPAPGPISVLGEFLRIGQVPPPRLILCAIAEAETTGRDALALDIVRVFVAPVVHQHEFANPRHAAYERGSCALPRSPRETALPVPVVAPAPHGVPSSSVQAPQAPQVPHGTTRLATDEEIRAMLNADPQKFIEMATHGVPVIEVPGEAGRQATQAASMLPMPSSIQAAQPLQPPVLSSPQPLQSPVPSHAREPAGLPPELVAQMQEAAGLHEDADQTRALAPGSPLVGVSDDAWRVFVVRLERESPLFDSSRHVGQYRQRRERLAELDIDSRALRGSAQAQRAALDADLVDAHHHAAEGGLLVEHLGRQITVPGHEGSETITLSGVLGVIQCAGLDGAVGWLERPSDRKRYPHTTQAFTRTNGVF